MNFKMECINYVLKIMLEKVCGKAKNTQVY